MLFLFTFSQYIYSSILHAFLEADSMHIGVPFGLGIIHTAWHEHLLIRYGSAIEDMLGTRPRLRFLNLHARNYPYVGNPPR